MSINKLTTPTFLYPISYQITIDDTIKKLKSLIDQGDIVRISLNYQSKENLCLEGFIKEMSFFIDEIEADFVLISNKQIFKLVEELKDNYQEINSK